MIPRGRLDIAPDDLAFAVAACGRRHDAEALERRIADASAGDESLVTLSVRSGLDLLLTALALPPEAEVLVSAITIRGMVEVIEAHGLVAVPVEVDMDDLSVSVEALETAVGPRTRAVLVAHLFGSRMPLDGVVEWARARSLVLIEDCAQSFAADGYWGHDGADVALTSFGPIKTATALGGAVLRVPDPELRERLRRLRDGCPPQGRAAYAARVARFGTLQGLLARPVYTAICAACDFLATDHDRLVGAATRGFGGEGGEALIGRIRRRPSAPLLAFLARRLETYDPERIARRAAAAREADARLDGLLPKPGRAAAVHHHWVYPVVAVHAEGLARLLWERGYDATPGRWSLCAVPAPEGESERGAPNAAEAMDGLTFLPVGPWLRPGELDCLAQGVRDWVVRWER